MCVDLQIQVWPAVFVELFVHAERLKSKLPSKREQSLWHGSWQPSEEARNVLGYEKSQAII